MAEKTTRKDLFVRIKEVMANDPEVVEMCDKYIVQLSKPRKKKVDEAMVRMGEQVTEHLKGMEPQTNKELRAWYNETVPEEEQISSQKMAAVMRFLVGQEIVNKVVGDKATDPVRYELI